MLIKQAIKILLTEDPGIAALVGRRIFPLVVPQNGPFPLIAWGRTARSADPVLDSTKRSQRLIVDRFEIASVAQGAGGDAVSEDIDDAVFELLDGWAGVVSDDASPESTLTIQGIFHEKLTELYRDDLKQYATRSIYRVHSVRQQRPTP
jgi:hypothetical protein